MAMHAEQGSNLLAVLGVAARREIQRVQPLSLLDVFFPWHPPLQLGGAFGNRWHSLSHPASPLLVGDRGE
jgi:hypothetical protein